MTTAQVSFLFFILAALIVIVVIIWVNIFRYLKARVSAPSNTGIIRPKKINFLFSWYVYFYCFFIPLLLLFWFIRPEMDLLLFLVIFEHVFWALIIIVAYPYYTLVLEKNELKGPTLWGWLWRHEKIAFVQIDKEKTLKRNFGRKLGFVVFYSLDGRKILSLGLDNSQVNQILALASETSLIK
jgi:hypothetical protein